jgi:hypothetical protein
MCYNMEHVLKYQMTQNICLSELTKVRRNNKNATQDVWVDREYRM